MILHKENTETSLALNIEPLQAEELSRPDELQPSDDPSVLRQCLSALPEDPFYSDHYYCRKPEQTEGLMHKREIQVRDFLYDGLMYSRKYMVMIVGRDIQILGLCASLFSWITKFKLFTCCRPDWIVLLFDCCFGFYVGPSLHMYSIDGPQVSTTSTRHLQRSTEEEILNSF